MDVYLKKKIQIYTESEWWHDATSKLEFWAWKKKSCHLQVHKVIKIALHCLLVVDIAGISINCLILFPAQFLLQIDYKRTTHLQWFGQAFRSVCLSILASFSRYHFLNSPNFFLISLFVFSCKIFFSLSSVSHWPPVWLC